MSNRVNESVCRTVTQTIIDFMANADTPWVQPWKGDGLPRNRASGKPYRGINTLLLLMAAMRMNFRSNLWLTFNQLKRMGGRVKPGMRGTGIVFFSCHEGAVMLVDELTGEVDETIEKRWFLRNYIVFNVEQTTLEIEAGNKAAFSPIEAAEDLVAEIPAVIEHSGDKAYYNMVKDTITLPAKEAFESADAYYATLLHELTHWTGHSERLSRLDCARFGSDSYAKEELTAELGSAFVCAHLGIARSRLQHGAAYIKSWLKILNNDIRFIFKAANDAQKACDYIMSYQRKPAKRVKTA
ncbi:MAG: ssDNA-binding domain-containing protein [Leptospirales bacterium]|nr:ssDNA-binding domain-containing protein [Leptospirales bacterium]HNN76756.1 zincin-like metallopeptidase domain-containing protein [Leptospiraceae bacterium]